MLLQPYFIFSLLGAFSATHSFVKAYDIDPISCGPVQGDGTSYIERAVADVHLWLNSGMNHIHRKQKGNARTQLWNTTKPIELQQVRDNLERIKNTFELFEYKIGSSPLIFCHERNFVKSDGDGNYKDPRTETVVHFKRGVLRPVDKKGKTKPHCATTFRQNEDKIPENPESLSTVIILYDVGPGLNGVSPDSSRNVATFDEIWHQEQKLSLHVPSSPQSAFLGQAKRGLYSSKPLDGIVGYWLTPFTLLHEFTHIIQPAKPDNITSGKHEAYGYKACANLRKSKHKDDKIIRSFKEAILNADTYAYWCLSALIEKKTQYAVLDGVLFDPPKPQSPKD